MRPCRGQAIVADVSAVRPGPVRVSLSDAALIVEWADGESHAWQTQFALKAGEPLITSITEDNRTIVSRAEPVYRCSTGKRRGGWNVFFGFPPAAPEGKPCPQTCLPHMSAAMRGEEIRAHEVVFLMNETGKDGTPEMFQPGYRGARTRTHTYAVMATGRWCLYNNVADPFQLKNLIKETSQAALIKKLNGLISGWMQETGDIFPFKEALVRYPGYPI